MRAAVIARDRGRCVACGVTVASDSGPVAQYSIQHRKARGMGGSKNPAVHAVTNLLLMCGTGTTGCHGKAERERAWARGQGFAVSQYQDPATVPVNHVELGWVVPTVAGSWVGVNPASLAACLREVADANGWELDSPPSLILAAEMRGLP